VAQAAAGTIKYYGWSSFSLGSAQGELLFDPIFRIYSGVSYATPEDYANAKVICVTHGHQEHYFDVPAIVKSTDAVVVAGKEVCNHLRWVHGVDRKNLVPIEPFECKEVRGFKISAFTWRHRDINPIRGVLRPQIIEGMKWAWQALIMCPAWARFMGFHVEMPDGRTVLNYNEGFNSNLRIEEIRKLAATFKTDILLAGMQLNFEDKVAAGAELLKPKTVVLFHPHKEFFRQLGKVSSSPEVFAETVKKRVNGAQVVSIDPGWVMA